MSGNENGIVLLSLASSGSLFIPYLFKIGIRDKFKYIDYLIPINYVIFFTGFVLNTLYAMLLCFINIYYYKTISTNYSIFAFVGLIAFFYLYTTGQMIIFEYKNFLYLNFSIKKLLKMKHYHILNDKLETIEIYYILKRKNIGRNDLLFFLKTLQERKVFIEQNPNDKKHIWDQILNNQKNELVLIEDLIDRIKKNKRIKYMGEILYQIKEEE